MTTRLPRRRALAGTLAAAALALSAGALTAVPAQALAPGLNPDNRLGDITLDATSGAMSSTGRPQQVATTAGCPVGYRNSSRVLFLWPDGTWPQYVAANDSGFPALTKQAGVALEGSGLDGAPINRTGTSAARWMANGWPTSRFDGRSGVSTYLVTCDPGDVPGTTVPDAPSGVGESKYFSVELDIVWDETSRTGTWSVVEEVARTETSTALAPSGVTATSATLTATVAPVEATGIVTFANGTTALGSSPVSGGVASVPVSGLSPNTVYSFTAEYSGDETYAPSTDEVSFTTLPAADEAETDIGVAVPEPESSVPTGLSISVAPESATLTGGARAEGSPWEATGELGDTTVNDDRRNAAGEDWTLNGRVSAFTSGASTIAASNLAWTPVTVSGAGSAGAPVGDLSVDQPLATGAPSGESNVQTTVGAGLTLTVPATTPAGDYTATLSLTLI